MKWKFGFADIEADGLDFNRVQQVHCLAVSVDGEGPVNYVKEDVPKGLDVLDQCENVVFHNGYGYDMPVLVRLFNWWPKGALWDTLLLSQIIHPDIQGGHGLEAWGQRLGEEKQDYKTDYIAAMQEADPEYEYQRGDEWRVYNDVMGEYCEQDVRVTVALFERLKAEAKAPDKGVSYGKAIRIEHEFARHFCRQMLRGVQIDVEHCRGMIGYIDSEMERIEREVEPNLPAKKRNKGQQKEATPPKKQYKADGQPTALVYKWFDDIKKFGHGEWEDGSSPSPPAGVCGSESGWAGKKFDQWFALPTPMGEDGNRLPLIDEIPMKLKDQQDLKDYLMGLGWIPTQWNYKTKPDKNGKMRIVRDDQGEPVPTWPKFHDQGELCPNLDKIKDEFDQVGDVVRWVILRHRRSIFEGLLENLRDDNRVSAQGMTMGTPTARVTHKVVANVPKASPDVILGKECRQAFTARPGAVMVGVDAEGLEFRILAHYMADSRFTEAVVKGNKEDGTDAHTVMLKATDGLVKSRDVQKNVNYGLIYGAGDAKLGQTAGHGGTKAKKAGAKIRDSLMKGLPKLGNLVSAIEKAAKRGYIIAIDGRKISVRNEHAALNTLLQAGGSIVVKVATNYANQVIKEKGLRAWQVVHKHDEMQLECHPDDAEEAGQAFIDGLKYAEKVFGLRCPLDGEVIVGKDWASTH